MTARRSAKPAATGTAARDTAPERPAATSGAPRRRSVGAWLDRLPSPTRLAGIGLKAVAAVALVTAAVEWKRRTAPSEPPREKLAATSGPPLPTARPAGLDTRALGLLTGDAARTPAGQRRPEKP